MTIDKKTWDLWNNISFKTMLYKKNFDFIDNNDSIITNCDGVISKLRIIEEKKPLIIGEYMISIWDIRLSKLLNINIKSLLNNYKFIKSYEELLYAINSNQININNYDKIIYINTFVIHKEYRKKGIVDEFFEMIYRDFYNENTLILIFALPFQYNPIDLDYFKYRKFLSVDDDNDNDIKNKITAINYYKLNEFLNNKNFKSDTHKIHLIMKKFNFTHIKNSNIFIFNSEYFIKRIIYKKMNSDRIQTN